MKKLLILLFSILISSNSYGEELNSLFGITLNDNAEKYVSSNYIDSNKFKVDETISGYFDLDITDKIETKSPYFSTYDITNCKMVVFDKASVEILNKKLK